MESPAGAADDVDGRVDACALVDAAAAFDDVDAAERWKLISTLHGTVGRVAFEAVQAAATSENRLRRLVGVDALAQIGYRADRPFLEETLPVLIAGTGQGEDVLMVRAAVFALGHVADVRGQAAVLRHVRHPHEDVRFAVAFSLPSLADEAAPDEEVVEALITLTRDPADEVRDWATFGLGSQLAADSPAIREALAARLADPDEATAEEAVAGLAQRGDPRAFSPSTIEP